MVIHAIVALKCKIRLVMVWLLKYQLHTLSAASNHTIDVRHRLNQFVGLEGIEIFMNGFVQDFVSNKPIIPLVRPIIKGTCLKPSEIEVLEE